MIGPLHEPVTWYRINYAGTQNNAVGLPKQPSPTFLWFGSPTALFASQDNLFRTMHVTGSSKGLLPALFEHDELLTKLGFS